MKIESKEILYLLIVDILFILSNRNSQLFGIAVFLLIIVSGLFFNTVQKNFYLIYFLIPNLTVLETTGIPSAVNLMIFVLALKNLLFSETYENGHRKIYISSFNRSAVVTTILILLIEVIHNFFYRNWTSGIISAINIAFDFLLFSIIISKNDSIDQFKCATYLGIGAFFSGINYIIVNPNITDYLLSTKYRFVGYAHDPNYYSMYIIISICFMMMYIYESKCFSIGSIILIVALIGVGLLTISKMFLLCIASLFVIFLFLQIKGRKYKSIVAFAFLFTAVVIILMLFYKPEFLKLIDKFTGRLNSSNGSFSSLTTGRSTLQAEYLYFSFNHPLIFIFGCGLDYADVALRMAGIVNISHNTYIDFLLSWGVLGSIIVIVGIVKSVQGAISFSYRKFIYFLPLIYFLIMLFALSCLSADMFWYILALCLLPLSSNCVTV